MKLNAIAIGRCQPLESVVRRAESGCLRCEMHVRECCIKSEDASICRCGDAGKSSAQPNGFETVPVDLGKCIVSATRSDQEAVVDGTLQRSPGRTICEECIAPGDSDLIVMEVVGPGHGRESACGMARDSFIRSIRAELARPTSVGNSGNPTF